MAKASTSTDIGRAVALIAEAYAKIKSDLSEIPLIDAEVRLWPNPTANVQSMNFDSMDFVELVLSLEDVFGIQIPEEDIDIYELETIGDLAKLIVAHSDDLE